MYKIMHMPEDTVRYMRPEYWYIESPKGEKLSLRFNSIQVAQIVCDELNSLIQEEEDHADV